MKVSFFIVFFLFVQCSVAQAMQMSPEQIKAKVSQIVERLKIIHSRDDLHHRSHIEEFENCLASPLHTVTLPWVKSSFLELGIINTAGYMYPALREQFLIQKKQLPQDTAMQIPIQAEQIKSKVSKVFTLLKILDSHDDLHHRCHIEEFLNCLRSPLHTVTLPWVQPLFLELDIINKEGYMHPALREQFLALTNFSSKELCCMRKKSEKKS